MNLKKLGKELVCRLLERQVKQLRAKNDLKIIVVGGSVGKTSTKLAIARTLQKSYTVIYQDGNYNDRLTVPLVLFGHTQPNLFNVVAWVRILLANQRTLKQNYPYKIAVLEVGADGPGQLIEFAYLKPDLYVLTSIADEHMEYFGSLDKVAEEELALTNFSNQVLVNVSGVEAKYLPKVDYLSYGIDKTADYKITKEKLEDISGQELTIDLKGESKPLVVRAKLLGSQGAAILLAAAAVAHIFEVPSHDIKDGLESMTPASGRMQLLNGLNKSLIIDDTYNASPIAVKAALDVLYNLQAKKRIVILGSMNELGPMSAKEHVNIGKYCNPKKLDLVVTIGHDSKKYLAPAAKTSGCQVVSFDSPIEAGSYLRDLLEPDMIVLAKGSQNGVFAEEAVKLMLADPKDASKLVRQTKFWLNIKARQF